MKNKSFIPQWLRILLLFVGLVLLFAIIFYPIKLGYLGISNNPNNWGAFGDYYNVIISTINTIAVLILSYAVYRDQIRRNKWETQHLELQEKPSLIFVAHEGKYYKLYNMGKGTGHKIVIGKISSDKNEIEIPSYKAYSIPPNAHIIVDWATGAKTLYAYYENEKKAKFLVKCEGDINEEVCGEEATTVINYLNANAQRKDRITLIMP